MKRPWMRMVAVLLPTVALCTLGACGSSDEAGTPITTAAPAADDTSSRTDVEGTITVFAPMPLSPVLTRAAEAFEAAHPGAKVEMSYGHVPALLAQLKEGVTGDVLLTPDEGTMTQAADASLLAGSPTPLATSPLSLVVPAGNPGRVTGVDSLDDEDLTIVLCAAELPCGKLAGQLAEKAGVTVAADSQDPGGSPAIVAKAATGEIDLGVVYAVDVKAGGDEVEALPIDEEAVVASQVTGARLADAEAPDVAAAFLAFLTSDDGQALFDAAGFVPL